LVPTRPFYNSTDQNSANPAAADTDLAGSDSLLLDIQSVGSMRARGVGNRQRDRSEHFKISRRETRARGQEQGRGAFRKRNPAREGQGKGLELDGANVDAGSGAEIGAFRDPRKSAATLIGL
jgi:hypothetical protein